LVVTQVRGRKEGGYRQRIDGKGRGDVSDEDIKLISHV
jgi:hypothetical protein